jgi:hypothetical protein
MVESTAKSIVTANIEAPEDFVRMDNVDIYACDVWYNNIMALIKLRKKGTTKLSKLAKGVFRCVLEY